jgi:fido (protein-threonine AMPylation protein)
MSNTVNFSDFDEYIRQGEPEKRLRAEAWQTAIGLQAVDGLKTSEYLRQTAQRNIEGEISIDEAKKLITSYYASRSNRENISDGTEEADRAASNITQILTSDALDFSANGLISLHRRIFSGVFSHAGKIRDYNITKKEWVLEGETVFYLNYEDLRPALEYEISKEKLFSYQGLSGDEIVRHITTFVSDLWQIHAFGEGNTRTTAVFTILYLRSIGFNVDNQLFANCSWYFRNALVRANYKNAKKGVDYRPVYLERFFRNLLFGESWDLRNRYLHVNPPKEWKIQPNLNAPTSTRQVPNKYRTSTEQVPNKFSTNNLNIKNLVRVIGNNELSVKEMLDKIGLKQRVNFLNLYLNPAIAENFVRMYFPDSPRHPRQKYLLTVKGLALYNEIINGI